MYPLGRKKTDSVSKKEKNKAKKISALKDLDGKATSEPINPILNAFSIEMLNVHRYSKAATKIAIKATKTKMIFSFEASFISRNRFLLSNLACSKVPEKNQETKIMAVRITVNTAKVKEFDI